MDAEEILDDVTTDYVRGRKGCGICDRPEVAAIVAAVYAKARESGRHVVISRLHERLARGLASYPYDSVSVLHKHYKRCESQ